jgi:phosphate transport system permease protein
VWTAGAALTTVLLMTVVLIAVVMINGLGYFWPAPVMQARLGDDQTVIGEWMRTDTNPDTGIESVQFKTGNRELDPQRQDFYWYPRKELRDLDRPPGIFVLERVENGNFYGFLKEVVTPTLDVPDGGDLADQFGSSLELVRRRRDEELAPIEAELKSLSYILQRTRDVVLKLEYRRRKLGDGPDASEARQEIDERLAKLQAEEDGIRATSDRLVAERGEVESDLRKNVARFEVASGAVDDIVLADVVRVYNPNDMSWLAKSGHYASKVWELVWAEPRESNTEGGLFPAIFGTVMLVFLMAFASFPLGVLAGIYLGEYAREGVLVRLVRIAVNNLAGIPSIVYGIFGLGFFVIGFGGLIDQWFFPERAEIGVPTYGTGGILWASMTLGLLTVPVVIVATEEALRTIPREFREGSYALGATKFQTLYRVLLPMASPGIMTGFILATARAAGEVAPLMITGVVKLAPSMPLDGQYPYFHLDRKFMHLGFHIYDIGFQSPNVEATKPMVYVTTFLLVLIVLAMSSIAIYLRNYMQKRFRSQAI